MMKAILILSTLVGYSTAIKIGYKLKSQGFNFDKKEKKDYEELLKDPRFRKYMR